MRNFDVGKLLEDHEPSKVPEKKTTKVCNFVSLGFYGAQSRQSVSVS